MLLSLLSMISPKFRAFLPNVIERAFDTLDQNRGWIVGFLFALLYGAILYEFLFAPYGVLCILHLRPCGT